MHPETSYLLGTHKHQSWWLSGRCKYFGPTIKNKTFHSHKDGFPYWGFSHPAFWQPQRSSQSQFADRWQSELYPSASANPAECCPAHPCGRLCWGMLGPICYQGIQTLRSWELGSVAPFLSFQLKITGFWKTGFRSRLPRACYSTCRLEMR